jgi:type IV pilus assembly protein PilE
MKGFHIIEILITLAVIAILTTIAIPSYSSYITNARRLEATHTLARLSVDLEHYFIEHDSYEGVSLSTLHIAPLIAKNAYSIQIQSASNHDYILTATPLGKQAERDTHCAILTINSLGEKHISGDGKVDECW